MQVVTKQQGGPENNSETTLFERAQTGCRQSLNLLMTRHEGLIHAVIHKQYLYGLPYEDVLQAGRSALWRAIISYESQRGTAFSTYAWVIIMRSVWEDEGQEPGRQHELVAPQRRFSLILADDFLTPFRFVSNPHTNRSDAINPEIPRLNTRQARFCFEYPT